MSECEERLFDQLNYFERLQYLKNAHSAETWAKRLIPAGGNGGHQDALRHAVFSYLNTRDLGSNRARALGVAHEDISSGALKDMDLWNNDIGIAVAVKVPLIDIYAITDYFVKMMNNGSLRIVVDGNLVPTTHK